MSECSSWFLIGMYATLGYAVGAVVIAIGLFTVIFIGGGIAIKLGLWKP